MEIPPAETLADGDDVTVTLRLFARARDLAGSEHVKLKLRRSGTIRDLKAELAARHPALRPLIPSLLVAINNNYVGDEQPVIADAEIACFPPVSGG